MRVALSQSLQIQQLTLPIISLRNCSLTKYNSMKSSFILQKRKNEVITTGTFIRAYYLRINK